MFIIRNNYFGYPQYVFQISRTIILDIQNN